MRVRTAMMMLALVIGTAAAQTVLPEPTEPPVSVAGEGRSGVPDLENRLRALSPDEPLGYFELGEEVAYEMPFKEGQQLARTLLVLAFELERASGRNGGVSRSACLALADLSVKPSERRWLMAMAAMEPGEGRRSGVLILDAGENEGVDAAPFDLAVAIGWFRSEEFRRSRDAFGREDAVLVLRRAGMEKDKAEQFLAEIRDRISRGVACDRCRNERVIRKAGESRPTYDLCPVCHGNPGPRLSEQAYVDSLRIEAMLLDCEPTSWAASTLLSVGQPLRDAEPDELSAWFGVNPHATRWEPGDAAATDTLPDRAWLNGRWVEDGDTPPPVPAPEPEAKG